MKYSINYRGQLTVSKKLKGNITRALKRAVPRMKENETVKINLHVRNCSYSNFDAEVYLWNDTPDYDKNGCSTYNKEQSYNIVVYTLKRKQTTNSTGQILKEKVYIK